jgi:large subunit ribosomal protein L13e
VKTWFDQPGRKLRRRNARKAKAASLGVQPLTLLRPAVRGQTVRYNRKVREGRGFTFTELKEAGIGRKDAPSMGIVVDHRRRNLSVEGLKINVERLKAYKARLVVFPRRASKPKRGDSSVRLVLLCLSHPSLIIIILVGRRSQSRNYSCSYPPPSGLLRRTTPKNNR